MSKHSPTLLPLYARDGVLVKQESLSRRNIGERKIIYAQRCAKELIKIAEGEAEEIRQDAYLNGYKNGILTGLTSVIDYINMTHETVQNLYKEMHEDIRNRLKSVLNNADVFCLLMDEWLVEINDRDNNDLLHLLLPKVFMRDRELFSLAIKKAWQGKVSIEFHDENYFLLKYRDKLAEFSPEEFSDNESTNLLRNKVSYELYEKASQRHLKELPGRLEELIANSSSLGSEKKLENEGDEHDNQIISVNE